MSCVVTGASSCIGAATARHPYGLGAKVTPVARRTGRIEALAAELPGTRDVTITWAELAAGVRA